MCEERSKKPVLAMYDVRGIQKYIFRTAKVKDAIGASRIVENIILEALEDAVKEVSRTGEAIKACLEWYGEAGWLPYQEAGGWDIQVLFIGGGNAFVVYQNKKLCLEINRRMAYYTLRHTYSLQLAVAVIEKSEDYAQDYRALYAKMGEVKAEMVVSKPLGTLPVMKMEIKTGYPMVSEEGSTETLLKQESGLKKQKGIREEERRFDSLVTEKGVDSVIAVVHIDGNSMGQRIRERIAEISDYTKAVNTMREVSYHINHSYKKVFSEMKDFFDGHGYLIREILVAGDDITFVCNGKIALAAVEYYCREITRYTMNGKADKESIQKYGFSVCAGVAYIGSHFPFSIGYEVAEACCGFAKDRAKNTRYRDGERVGNFVDFHICKNIQAQNLKETRSREYQTSSGERLCRRPYYIRTDNEGGLSVLNQESFSFEQLKQAILYFQDEKNLPRSFAKELRGCYALGESQVELLYAFLESRGWNMPDRSSSSYLTETTETGAVLRTAKWYDALELMDDYIDLEAIIKKGGTEHGEVSDQNNIAE